MRTRLRLRRARERAVRLEKASDESQRATSGWSHKEGTVMSNRITLLSPSLPLDSRLYGAHPYTPPSVHGLSHELGCTSEEITREDFAEPWAHLRTRRKAVLECGCQQRKCWSHPGCLSARRANKHGLFIICLSEDFGERADARELVLDGHAPRGLHRGSRFSFRSKGAEDWDVPD